MRASTKMTQNGKNKDSFSRRAQARQDKNSRAYPKLASQAMKSKIWHNWLTKKTPLM